MQLKQVRPVLVFSVVFLAIAAAGRFAKQSYSANLTNVSVTLSNSRLSFKGALGAGNTVGSSQVTLNNTVDAYPSTNSAQLQQGDVIKIGSAGVLNDYTVASISAENAYSFTTTAALASGDTEAGDDVIASQSSTLTLGFTTQTAVASGIFQVLIPADAASVNADGIPDQGYFDFGTSVPTVTCPTNADTVYDFVAGVATASAVTIDSRKYHSYICAYSGTGAVGTAFSTMTINNVINPAPKINHIAGTADTYRPIIRHLNVSTALVDETTVSIGVLEAVRVTASVAPLITFEVSGVASGVSTCGTSTSVGTSATAVPFGELLISGFTNAAQALTVSTNAADGYAVTATENDQLSRNNVTCTGAIPASSDCIVDSIGDTGAMLHSAGDEWSATTVKGFGYSLDDVNTSGLTPVFEYDSSADACDGTGDCFRQFADAEVPDAATQIFSAADVADNHNLYICYRAVISTSQAAGNYENYITYTATANF
ncbi:MAG: hypothetical protein GW947_04400 [Candidatus Pacebacteria bacterium]|nr:hypothetical protein [Candidatus Paceibacterota bacterium]PIR59642.1 MAG: hypothetical protein COU68_04505 [Candidatus Pacebacteria bacterium CG10_big_fil_rev_8_21_14_0_10_45_6]